MMNFFKSFRNLIIIPVLTVTLVTTVFSFGQVAIADAQVNIVSISPTNSASNVSVSANVEATFSAGVNFGTVSKDTFVVYGLSSGIKTGSYSYDQNAKKIIFTPSSNFFAGEIIYADISSGIKDLVGNSVAPYSWSFSVKSSNLSGFGQQTKYSVGATPRFIYAADLNNDKNIDLVTCNWTSPGSISVLIGDGNGTFQPEVAYPVDSNPESIFAADFNKDGNLDLVTANTFGSNVPPDNSFSVLLGNGDGTFQPAVDHAAGWGPVHVFPADFNGDGNLDLAAGNVYSDNVSVLLGKGDGTFFDQVFYPIEHYSHGIFSADFNNDGKIDIVASNRGGGNNNISMLKGKGDGTFDPKINYPTGIFPTFLFSSDFNRDGFLDLVSAHYTSSFVDVLLNKGDGTFDTPTQYNTGGNGTRSVFCADFNNDNLFDIVATNKDSDTLSILYGKGDGTFDSPIVYDTGDYPIIVFAADFNNDGALDLATANYQGNDVSILLGLPVPTPVSTPTPTPNSLSSATVIPRLPETGASPVGKSIPQILIIADISVATSLLFYLIRKKYIKYNPNIEKDSFRKGGR